MEDFVERGKSSEKNLLQSLLDKGEWLARTGQLDRSFSAYSHAFRVGVVPKEQISSLVRALLDFESTRICKEEPHRTKGASKEEIFTCPLCKCLFMEPVTLACGHTFCRICLTEEQAFYGFASCNSCSTVTSEDNKAVNVLIATAIQKWFPTEYQMQEKKLKGHNFLVENNLRGSIDCFNFVLSSANDFHCFCWRADAYIRLGLLDSALQDINKACKLRPNLARTFHRKAVVLADLARYEGVLSSRLEESVLALLRCCSLAPECDRYRQELTESLYQLLSPKFTSFERSSAVLKLLNFSRPPVENMDTVSKGVNKKQIEMEVSDMHEPENLSRDWFRVPSKRSLQSQSFSKHNDSSLSSVFSKQEKKRPRCSSPTTRPIKEREIKEDFECNLCYSLLLQPITTICGHTFCRECLERSLDHRMECPCCRQQLVQYCNGRVQMKVTEVVAAILAKYFTAEYNERKRKSEEEMEKLKSSWKDQCPEIPIFVCTLAFPNVQCPLHVFEPKYRLMLRRCIKSGSRQFGMCFRGQDPHQPFSDFGTMLKIKTLNILPDGRSIIHTIGGRRFRVLSRSMKDSYDMAKVEWLEDERVGNSEELRELAELNKMGYFTMQRWFGQMSKQQQQCVVNAIGPIPALLHDFQWSADGPDWIWWLLAALPLQDKPKLIILGMTSLGERLKSVMRFLQLMLTLQTGS